MSKDIFDLMGENDIPGVKRLLQETPSIISSRNEYGFTPLYEAVLLSAYPIIYLLLRAGASPDEKTDEPPDESESPREASIRLGRHEISEIFLGKGDSFDDNNEELSIDSLNESDEDGNTLLHHMASNNDVDSVIYLLSRGVDIKRNNKGETPLDIIFVSGTLSMRKGIYTFIRMGLGKNMILSPDVCVSNNPLYYEAVQSLK
jgi:ankyrin repeat protein